MKQIFSEKTLDIPGLSHGSYDIVGDIHGCWDELQLLLGKAGWIIEDFDLQGSDPIHAFHPQNRHLVFVGDLTDRGPKNHLVLRLAIGMIMTNTLSWVIGNHDWKLARAILGSNVMMTDELQQTLDQIKPLGDVFALSMSKIIHELPYELHLPMPRDHVRGSTGEMIVVHGALCQDPDLKFKQRFSYTMYGIALDKREDGTTIRQDWASCYHDETWILYGHTPMQGVRILNNTIALDTGCVFGNHLALYKADSMEILTVDALANHSGVVRYLEPIT